MLVAVFVPQVVNAADSPVVITVSVSTTASEIPADTYLSLNSTSSVTVADFNEAAKVLGVSGTLESSFDLTLLDSTTHAIRQNGESVTVKCDAVGLKSYDTVTLVHYSTVSNKFELINAIESDGSFSFTVSNFSPFAVYITRGTPPTTTPPTSPSTGVYN